MQKNLVFVAILAVLVVFIAGCTGTTQGSVKTNTSAEVSGGNQPTPNAQPPGGNEGTPTPSGGKVDLSTCMASCTTVVESKLQATCKTGCYLAAAGETKDVTKCDEMLTFGDPAIAVYDNCVMSVATKVNDASMCAKIKSDSFYSICLSAIADAKADASICAQIKDDTTRDGCISTVAAKQKDASICATITLDYMKEPCVSGANGQQ